MAKSIGVNADLVRERSASSFFCDELTHVWDGGHSKTDRRRYIESLVASDPEFATHGNEANMSRHEQFMEQVRRHTLVWKRIKERNLKDPFDQSNYLMSGVGVNASGLLLHETAFLLMLNGQASAEQLHKWRPLLDSNRMIGCYAQTELGHGTHVRGLETTATYDPVTKTFVVDSPTLSATKWWIGALGLLANHAVVLAQLYTKGQCHGMHAFLVQIRDIDTHKPLPGVIVGDIGPKLGLNAVDNGFVRFSRVRIPHQNMLMRHSKVLEDGTYVKPPNTKLVYGSMLAIRAHIPFSVSTYLAAAVTVATRYSAVRRQSELKSGAAEVQVLDFQTQQHKLFPLIAMAYGYRIIGHALIDMFYEVMNEVESGNYRRLIELHALSCGFKALVTTRAISGIEQCRLACGGHGYSLASGIPLLYGHVSVFATAEGEATILLLQTARYLMKNCLQASRGNRVDTYCTYLVPGSITVSFDGRTDPESLVKAYAFRAQRIVTKTATHLQRTMSESGLSQELAWNECLVDLNNAALAHTDYVLVRLFAERVAAYDGNTAVKRVLVSLCRLYALHGLINGAAELLQEGYLNSVDLDSLKDALYSLYKTIRPDAVPLVDAFDFNDRFLNSAIGRYDGRVYESLYDYALQSSLNKSEVHESFHKYMKPLRSVITKSQL